MSLYAKYKVIRLPFPKTLIEKLGVKDCWDCEDYLQKIYGEQWDNNSKKNYMEICGTLKSYYLDFVIELTINEDFGEYGHVFLLNEEDLKLYKPIFDKMNIEYNPSDLRKVVYSYYNASEAPDYYNIEDINFESL